MKNKYAFIAYVIMGILAFIIIISLILARINLSYNKTIVDRNNEEILSLVDDAVNMCTEDYIRINASDAAMLSINDYVENIAKYDNVRTKANIALAMLTNASDYILSEEVKGNVNYSVNEEIQRSMAPLKLSLQTALELDSTEGE